MVNRIKNIQFLFLFLALAVSFSSLLAQEEPKVLDEIVARINNEVITLTDLQDALADLRNGLEQEIDDPEVRGEAFENQKKGLLQTMIRNKIMLQRAEDLGVSANIDADVAAYLEELRQESGIPNMEVLDQYLRQRGSSLSEYRNRLRENFVIRSLLQQFVYSKITLLTPEIEEYYEEHKDLYTEEASVELAEILFLTEGEDLQKVRKEAEAVLAELRSGASFEEMARGHSDGPTASNGGVIGSFRKGSINPALEEFAFSHEQGEISGIIETDYGLQIVKIIDRTESTVLPLEEVRPQITEALYQEKAEPELKDFLRELVEDSYVYVAPKYAEEYEVEDIVTAIAGERL